MMIIFLGIPVIMFLLKEPLGQLVEGKKPKAEGGVGMFLVQGFFELFETMLSFFSNTISFVRIGSQMGQEIQTGSSLFLEILLYVD